MNSVEGALAVLLEFYKDKGNIDSVNKSIKLLKECYKNNNKSLIVGNGGSACDAMHYAQELTGNFRIKRKAMPAIALTDPAHLTCVANDFGFEYVFSRGVEAFGNKGDVLILLSTSGNSKNIILACQTAKKKGIKTIALLGKGGGKMKGMADVEIIIPGETSDRIQELHMLILHTFIEGIETSNDTKLTKYIP